MIYERSFASHPKSKFWNYELNKVKPEQVALNSHTKYWFNCCHIFQIQLNTVNKGSWCKFCANQILCESQECTICYNKSFASHPKSNCWNSLKNTKTARQVFQGSTKNYWFKCSECLHEFETCPNNIKKGCWCKYCKSLKLCESQECMFCYNKSFASHSRAKYWHTSKNGNINPRQVFQGSDKKYWFLCENSHLFDMKLLHIKQNSWCAKCINKTEAIVLKFLEKQFKDDIKHQSGFEWCKNKQCLPFDFLIKSKQLLIELDGRQHFTQISNWASPEENLKRDIFKMKCALENGYRFIRILQEDVYYDNKHDWRRKLLNAINSNKDIVFISENNDYSMHKMHINIIKENLIEDIIDDINILFHLNKKTE